MDIKKTSSTWNNNFTLLFLFIVTIFNLFWNIFKLDYKSLHFSKRGMSYQVIIALTKIFLIINIVDTVKQFNILNFYRKVIKITKWGFKLRYFIYFKIKLLLGFLDCLSALKFSDLPVPTDARNNSLKISLDTYKCLYKWFGDICMEIWKEMTSDFSKLVKKYDRKMLWNSDYVLRPKENHKS